LPESSVSVAVPDSTTVSSIESLYKDKNSALSKELKKVKRALKESKILQEAATERAAQQVEEQRSLCRVSEAEADMLREKAFDLQAEVERLKAREAREGKADTFDGEGQFQMLYQETLRELNAERDRRHETAVSVRTEMQNLREEVEDAKEEAAGLRCELELFRRREADLEQGYQNDLKIEKEKEEMLEKELFEFRNESELYKKIQRLEAELSERAEGRGETSSKQKLMEKQIETMEEMYLLKEQLKDFEAIRKKLFFSLVLGLKLNESAKGRSCNHLDASDLWQEAQETNFQSWEEFIQSKIN
jgi:hypothetical protein